MIAVNVPIEAAYDAAAVLRYLVSQLTEQGKIARSPPIARAQSSTP